MKGDNKDSAEHTNILIIHENITATWYSDIIPQEQQEEMLESWAGRPVAELLFHQPSMKPNVVGYINLHNDFNS